MDVLAFSFTPIKLNVNLPNQTSYYRYNTTANVQR